MKTISSNPKAYYDYHILDEFIAGIALKGHEVKSAKLGKVNIKGSYIKPWNRELLAIGMNISKYMGQGEEERVRTLLLNKKEIDQIIKKIEAKGMTIIPLKVLLVRGLIKVKIALAKGKKNYDKREAIMKKEQKREMNRFIKNKNRWIHYTTTLLRQ